MNTETRTVFPYPGSKSYLAPWIIDQFPAHKCYVEPFGGAASVLFRKPKSTVEVYNDADGDVVQFFTVLRDRSDELVAWCKAVPYARDLHDEWADEYYAGERVDDPVERAGRFFFLRYAQTMSKYHNKAGYLNTRQRSSATNYTKSVADLAAFADRLRGVAIEHKDYAALIDHYDGPDTLFYFDPPYHDAEHLYPAGEDFDHAEFYDALAEIVGSWALSYTEVPTSLSEEHVSERTGTTHMGKNHAGNSGKRSSEKLITNYDPETTLSFSGSDQTTLAEVRQ